ILRSRSHNEEVVERLQFYINYQQDGEYQKVNAYGFTPFIVKADTAGFQALNLPLTITFKDEETFNLKASVPATIQTINYGTKEKAGLSLESQDFSRDYNVGERINLPFFKGVVQRSNQALKAGKSFYVTFQDFDGIAARYKGISVS